MLLGLGTLKQPRVPSGGVVLLATKIRIRTYVWIRNMFESATCNFQMLSTVCQLPNFHVTYAASLLGFLSADKTQVLEYSVCQPE